MSASASSDDELEPDFEDWGDDEPAPTKCLFTDTIYDSVAECLAAANTTHGLDLMKIARSLRLDMVGCVQLVNYVRFHVAKQADGGAVVAVVVSAAGWQEGEWPWRDDAYLTPVLPDDPLLYSLAAMADDGGEGEEAAEAEEGLGSAAVAEAVAEVRAMHAQMADVLSGVLRDEQLVCAAASAPNGTDKDGTAKAISARTGPRSGPSGGGATGNGAAAAAAEDAAEAECGGARGGCPVGPAGKRVSLESDASYFASYSRLAIHEEMLSDAVRTDGYRHAIESNGGLLQGKVVLDVGCGSGILSMFAARAGARLAIGVDASDIIEQARAVVAHNQLADRVQLHHSSLEALELPAPLERVDFLVSEWMGYGLLYESMLPTLIHARDRFLAPGGAVLPSACSLLLVGSSHNRLAFFDDVYGFSFTPIAEPIRAEAAVEIVPEFTVLTSEATLRTFAMLTVTDADLDFTAPFALTAHTAGELRSLVLHFDTDFDLTAHGGTSSRFRTSPSSPPTHWKQTVLYLRRPLPLAAGARVEGTLSLSRNGNYERGYDIAATLRAGDGPVDTQIFSMS